jgi:hypothetical protein
LPVLNPLHLLEQAELLLAATPGRKPRQVNLRRSVSSAYYAVFHHVLTTVADEFVGKGLRGAGRYTLVYRSVDHAAIRRICNEAVAGKPSSKLQKLLPADGFGRELSIFADNFLRLQKQRNDADYDSGLTFTSVDASFASFLAHQAIDEFNAASVEARKLFLTILLFPPR